jgi:hypothetical protein
MRALAVLTVAACGSSKPSPAAVEVAPALAAAMTEADHERAPWRCSGDLDEPAQEQLTGWKVSGRTLMRTDGELVIGVVADAGGGDPKTIASLGRLHAKLEQAHVTLVLALGGMGATQRELEATLGAVAGPWPVVALPGDLEAVGAEVAAIAALRARGAVVLDGRLVRWIEAPGAVIATVPGAGSPARLVAGDEGCAWTPEDVAALYGDLAAKAGVRIAATTEAPREIIAGEASGELALVPTQAIDIVVHGPTRPVPSADRSGGRDGAHVALSPGTADATTRLPQTTYPAAGLLAIRTGGWSWHPVVDRP